jgi:hypothetical protein
MRKLLAVLVVMALMLSLGGTAAAAAPTTVYLVNTLDRTVVDVYVDGNLILEDFAPDTIRGPFVGEVNDEVLIQMIPANTVLGEPNEFQYNAEAVMRPPAGATVAIVAQNDNIPGSLGTLTMFSYDLAPTGPGRSTLMVHNAMIADDIQMVLSPGTANEQQLPSFGPEHQLQTRLPAGPTTALLVLSGRGPAPYVVGPFTADLRPGKLYVVFVTVRFGVGMRVLRQEFNVGQ